MSTHRQMCVYDRGTGECCNGLGGRGDGLRVRGCPSDVVYSGQVQANTLPDIVSSQQFHQLMHAIRALFECIYLDLVAEAG
ncbi:hypothetical protein F511_19701 [Dorcoceras hygrometricum]|uniref:Uncharacterized protein n=1 Tax=Dorcoceras hygrometricum TaxID=472368 RepID=A0A2Z7AL03_9LAMI|nr:hypothetical protein F511_19701 [Dorcoceras hygrometricum]